MKNVLLLLPLFVITSCSHAPSAADIAAETAKKYYDELIAGHYNRFVNATFQPDNIPDNYHKMLIVNAKMFVAQQQEAHKGIVKINVYRTGADTAAHTANVILTFVYGDKTRENVVVPMLEYRGKWYFK